MFRSPSEARALRAVTKGHAATGSESDECPISLLALRFASEMEQGRLRVPSGLSASCSYRLTAPTGGLLRLPSALFLPLRESEDATLTMADGSEQSVHVTFGPAVG